MSQKILSLLAISMAVAVVAVACSSSVQSNPEAVPATGISVTDSWIRPGIDPTAIYFTISNSGTQPVTLTGVEADWAGEIDMHQTLNDNGFMEMVYMPELSVPAGGTLTFEPGGMHLMANDLHRTISDGDHVELALVTADGSKIKFSAEARGLTEMAMNDDDTSHDHMMDSDGDVSMEVEKHGAVFASGTIAPQKSYDFTFDHALTGIKIPYHNHLNGAMGSVMVMEGAEISGETIVTITPDGFHPADIRVAPGTVVTWVNTTEVAWTVVNGFPPQ